MPRPDLMPLTGGYRRTPVLQIGADIFCDTAIILRELEARFPMPALKLPGHEGLAQMVAGWTDGRWFQSSVAVIFGERGDSVPDAFRKDREALSGRPFDTNAMKAVAPMMRDQWRARLMLLEERLQGGKGAGSGIYLVGMKPGLVDIHAYMNVWFMYENLPDFVEKCFETADLTKAWFERLQEFEGQDPETIDPARAGRLHILEVQRLMRTSPKAIIAVVNGWAAGGGHSLHVVADLTLASREHGKFKQTDATVGSFDAGYGSALLARQVGQKRAREIFFTAREYSAEEMVAMGAVNEAVDHERLEEVALEYAADINRQSPQALRMLKFAFNLPDDGMAGQQVFAGEATRMAYMTDEAVEGRDAFLQKRDPDWSAFPYHF